MSRRKARNQKLSLHGNLGPLVPNMGLVEMPSDEKEVIKEVDARVDGETVGRCQIYDDGTVSVILNDDISEEALKKINFGLAENPGTFGYTIGEE